MRLLGLRHGEAPEVKAAALLAAWEAGELVVLAADTEIGRLRRALPPLAGSEPRRLGFPNLGAGVVVGSGGTSGGRRWCLQPLEHLRAAAAAGGRWLERLGIDPESCLHLNPLPLRHVSGLMPLVRAHQWGATHRWLPAELMREPDGLPASCQLPDDRAVLLSVVPTQLQRLLESVPAIEWLRRCSVIWVGGAALAPSVAERARHLALPLAPCYGATETAAMVCALTPERFLAGEEGCGDPLDDVQLRIAADGSAIEVCTPRLSPGWLEAGKLHPLPLQPGGWWRSGDAGRLGSSGLRLLGRLDGAVLSGGETVFPEQLEQRLLREAARRELPVQAVLLIGQDDAEWGERLEALVGPAAGSDGERLITALKGITDRWSPAERPRHWRLCPGLRPDAAGKWERSYWRQWCAAASPVAL